jgi:hypothetical protein
VRDRVLAGHAHREERTVLAGQDVAASIIAELAATVLAQHARL